MNAGDKIHMKGTRVRNTLPGTEGTYHHAVSSVNTCSLDEFAERAGKKCGQSAIVTKNVLGAVGAEAEDILSTRLYRISAFGLVVEAAIDGSVPSADAPLGPENKVYVAIRLSDELKNAGEGLVPTISGGERSVLNAVQDEESEQYGAIVGTRTFILTGWGLTTSGEGEGISAESKIDGTVTAATVSRNEHGQTVWAALDRALPPGKATVCVLTRGKASADDAPWPVRKTVTILAGEEPPEPPTPTGPTVTSVNNGNFMEGNNVVTGANMRFEDAYPGNHVVIKDGEGVDMGAMISTDESIPVTGERFGIMIDAGTPFTEGAEYVFEFEMLDADGQPVTVTKTATYVAE